MGKIVVAPKLPTVNNSTASVVILVDCSGSMKEYGHEGRRIDLARTALESIWADVPGARLFAFNDQCRPLEEPSQLPVPQGGTHLHIALENALALNPAQTIVISDGEPSNKTACLAVAELFPGTIDVIFCGNPSDYEAIAFMDQLGRVGAGTVLIEDLSQAGSLTGGLRKLLSLPGA